MNKKLITIDMDGTLLNNDEEISSKTIEVLKEVQKQGHIVCLITGRTHNMAKKLHTTSGLKTPIGLFNGAAIMSFYDKNFESVKYILNRKSVKRILKNKLLINATNGISIETLTETFMTDINSANAKLSIKWTGITPTIYKELDDINGEILAILAELNTTDDIVVEKIINDIKLENPDLEIAQSYNAFIEKYIIVITSKASRKDHALIWLANHYGIDMRDTIAFGDGGNDKYMLKAAGIGFAMKNAEDSVKSWANEITDFTNNEDGVALQIKKLFNI